MKYAQLLAVIALAGVAASAASADTIATFADPSPAGIPPLFTYNGAFLVGNWLGQPGLTLETPGLAAPDFANAQFSMAPVAVLGPTGPTTFAVGPGAINFFDVFNNPLLTITFSGGSLSAASIFGSSDFIGQSVTFSGPILGGATLSNEAFSFSFANPQGTLGNYTVSSSFTSSATIPGPGAAALLGLGGLVATRRRR
jgi:MYXO-CTERM domain-containing protein